MKVGNIELGYSIEDGSLFDIRYLKVYVLIPRSTKIAVSDKFMITEDTDGILRIDNNTNLTNYTIYEYYKTFNTFWPEPYKFYKQVMKENKELWQS